MAKDPVCGMFVEEKPESIRYNKDGENTTFVVNSAQMNLHNLRKN